MNQTMSARSAPPAQNAGSSIRGAGAIGVIIAGVGALVRLFL